jgi:hypothetical protein
VRWTALAISVGLTPVTMRLTSSLRRFPAPGLVRIPMHPTDSIVTGRLGHKLSFGPATLVSPDQDDSANVLVIGNRVWVHGPRELAGPSQRLARSAGLHVVRLHFARSVSDRTWRFAGAEVLPDIREPDAINWLGRQLIEQ